MESAQGRDACINAIIEKELAMFLATPNEGGTASCQQRPDTFRIMRWMAHSVHNDAVLASYLEDLTRAEATGRNFMLEKYARMDERIPPVSVNPLIPVIAEAEARWLEDAASRYPRSLQGNGSDIFRRYIACELETLSDKTLELYAEEVQDALNKGSNLVEERHNMLCQRMGYGSLAAREAAMKAKEEA